MNVVDSCAWLEYFANGPNAAFFAPAIEKTRELIVPTLSLYEVFKRIMQQRDEGAALQAVAVMRQGRVVDMDTTISLAAARLSLLHRLPLADGIMLAAAEVHGAELWTQDADFERIEGVNYRKPGKGGKKR